MFSAIDTVWMLLGSVLVFFMQAGFAMVETGFTRAKNAGNIIMKNLMDFALGTLVFWILGFGIMFHGDQPLFGGIDLFIQQDYHTTVPSSAFVIFQTVFCATAATIVSGAMAERTKFISYCVYSILISLLIYPISGHWIWGGGWLSQLGFHDFAGSAAVHLVGGTAALVGAKILGPRIGKFDKDGNPKAIPGHNLTIGALGVFILWFCWFGFNGGSTQSMSGNAIEKASDIFVTTNMAAATAAVCVMCITWIRFKKPDVSMTLNGALAGLVAITAGCDIVDPFGAFWIGLLSGFVVVFGIEFVEKVLHIDDPVGAIGVHGCCGAAGTILTGIFAVDQGVLYGHGFHFLGIQTLGVIAVFAWVAITMTIIFLTIKKTIGLRVSEEEELSGLDIEEHGLISSYADFMPMGCSISLPVSEKNEDVNIIESENNDESVMKKVVIMTSQNKFEALKQAMDAIGVTGMTITHVLGCGMQKGNRDYYRGVQMDMQLLPKIKVEIVIGSIPLQQVVNTAKKVLYTGQVGDGKIFVYDVDEVVKIRTGEKNIEALKSK